MQNIYSFQIACLNNKHVKRIRTDITNSRRFKMRTKYNASFKKIKLKQLTTFIMTQGGDLL